MKRINLSTIAISFNAILVWSTVVNAMMLLFTGVVSFHSKFNIEINDVANDFAGMLVTALVIMLSLNLSIAHSFMSRCSA